MAFAHTPYDGTTAPFTIGLKPLDLAGWLEIDSDYEAYLAEKDRLIAERPGDVFAAEPGTEDAQAEVLELVVDHLVRGWATIFPGRSQWDHLGERLPRFQTHGSNEPRLQIAARFVQEDLVLMRRSEDGWRLVAASLCFPSSWSLAEKFGRPLVDIHEPVPGFGRGTRPAELIERMFDKLAVGRPVWRFNWSLAVEPSLYLPLSAVQRRTRADEGRSRFGGDPLAAGFIRIERQTLRKLPRSGDILFTIRIHVDPLAALEKHEGGAQLASGLADQLAALDAAQLDYKGLAADRDRLVEQLRAVASGQSAV